MHPKTNYRKRGVSEEEWRGNWEQWGTAGKGAGEIGQAAKVGRERELSEEVPRTGLGEIGGQTKPGLLRTPHKEEGVEKGQGGGWGQLALK